MSLTLGETVMGEVSRTAALGAAYSAVYMQEISLRYFEIFRTYFRMSFRYFGGRFVSFDGAKVRRFSEVGKGCRQRRRGGVARGGSFSCVRQRQSERRRCGQSGHGQSGQS